MPATVEASAALSALRAAGWAPLTVRALTLVAAAVAMAATVLAPWDAPDALVAVALALVAGCIGLPDSPLPSSFCGVVMACWALRADGSLGVGVIVAAVALTVVHAGCAVAGAAPLPTAFGDDALRRWAGHGVVLVVGTLVAAGLLALLQVWDPAGSIVVTVAALVSVAALAWWWSLGDDIGDDA